MLGLMEARMGRCWIQYLHGDGLRYQLLRVLITWPVCTSILMSVCCTKKRVVVLISLVFLNIPEGAGFGTDWLG